MSHATASVRVEYSGIGPCAKIASRATSNHSGSQGQTARRCSERLNGLGDTGRLLAGSNRDSNVRRLRPSRPGATSGGSPVADTATQFQLAPQVQRFAPTVATAPGDEGVDRIEHPFTGTTIAIRVDRVGVVANRLHQGSEEHTSELQSPLNLVC